MTTVNDIADIQSLSSLYKVCELPDDEFDQWLVSFGLQNLKRTCWNCGRNMTIFHCKGRRKHGVFKKFVCPRKKCRKNLGFYRNTFFERSPLPPKEIMQLSWHWMAGTLSFSDIQKEMTRHDNSTVSKQTLVDWFQFFREFCTECLKNYPIVIGGPEVTIELRQTVLSLRGCDLCLLFGIERESKNSFTAPIDSGKNASVLLAEIEKHILDGTTILSDCWTVCGGIENLPAGYSKYIIRHSEDFPEDCASEVYKKMINEAWQSFLYDKNHRGDKISPNLYSYVMEFLWKLQFPMEKRFSTFWSHVRQLYPV